MDVATEVSHPSFKPTPTDDLEYIYVGLEKNVKDKMVHVFEHLNIADENHVFVRFHVFNTYPASPLQTAGVLSRQISVNPSQLEKFSDINCNHSLDNIKLDICVQHAKRVDAVYTIPKQLSLYMLTLLYNAECLTANSKYVRVMFKNEPPTQGVSIDAHDIHDSESPNLNIDIPPYDDLNQIWSIQQNESNDGTIKKWWTGSFSDGLDVVDTTAEEQQRLTRSTEDLR